LPPGYPHALSYEFAPPLRARRIREVLARADRLTVEDCTALQGDDLSLPARRLVPLLVAAARAKGDAAAPDGAALAAWEFPRRAHAAAPLLFEAWLAALGKRVYGERMAAHGLAYAQALGSDPEVLARLLEAPDGGVGSGGNPPREGRDAVVLAAFDDAR